MSEPKRKPAAKPRAVMQNMMPGGLARCNMFRVPGGPYTLRFVKDWCYVYKGRKRVWDCNDVFGRENFYQVRPATRGKARKAK